MSDRSGDEVERDEVEQDETPADEAESERPVDEDDPGVIRESAEGPGGQFE